MCGLQSDIVDGAAMTSGMIVNVQAIGIFSEADISIFGLRPQHLLRALDLQLLLWTLKLIRACKAIFTDLLFGSLQLTPKVVPLENSLRTKMNNLRQSTT